MTLYLKAIFGAVATAVTAVLAAYLPHHHIDMATGLVILSGFLGSLAVIWGVPNYRPPTPPPPAPPKA